LIGLTNKGNFNIGKLGKLNNKESFVKNLDKFKISLESQIRENK
jgi:hypothetical protein